MTAEELLVIETLRDEVARLRAHAEAISVAHGMSYGGTGDPEEAPPDEDDFDVWCVDTLRRERDEARALLTASEDEARDDRARAIRAEMRIAVLEATMQRIASEGCLDPDLAHREDAWCPVCAARAALAGEGEK
jgi:hypothetical protein